MQPWSVRPETRRSLADAKALSFVPDIYVKMEERRRSPREHAFCLLYLHVACAYIHIRGVGIRFIERFTLSLVSLWKPSSRAILHITVACTQYLLPPSNSSLSTGHSNGTVPMCTARQIELNHINAAMIRNVFLMTDDL